MTDIVYFGATHGHGEYEEVLEKLEDIKPDFLTIEDAPLVSISFLKRSRLDHCALVERNLRTEDKLYRRVKLGAHREDEAPQEGCLFLDEMHNENIAFLKYGFGKYPIFFVDTYRRFNIAKFIDDPNGENSVLGVLPDKKI